MFQLLRIIGLIFVSFCISHFIFQPEQLTNIEATINPNGESVIVCSSSGSGRYYLHILYNTDFLPSDVKDNFFNTQHLPRASWEAALTVSTANEVLLSTNRLQLEPAITSGKKEYFFVGKIDIKEPERLEIRLNPREAPPFGAIPSLAIRPSGVYYESYYLRNLMWHVANLVCIPIAFVLLFDLIKRMRRKTANMKT